MNESQSILKNNTARFLLSLMLSLPILLGFIFVSFNSNKEESVLGDSYMKEFVLDEETYQELKVIDKSEISKFLESNALDITYDLTYKKVLEQNDIYNIYLIESKENSYYLVELR